MRRLRLKAMTSSEGRTESILIIWASEKMNSAIEQRTTRRKSGFRLRAPILTPATSTSLETFQFLKSNIMFLRGIIYRPQRKIHCEYLFFIFAYLLRSLWSMLDYTFNMTQSSNNIGISECQRKDHSNCLLFLIYKQSNAKNFYISAHNDMDHCQWSKIA